MALWICDTTQRLKDISHLKIACCYLKEFPRLLWLKGRQKELFCFSLKSLTLQSYQGRCMQEFTRPIHLPGVFEGHLEAASQRQQSTSSTPAWWRNWDLTQELSWQEPMQCHSRRAPAGTVLGLGGMLGSPRFIGMQEKKSWEQGRVIPGSRVYSALNGCKHCSRLAF